MKLGRNKNTESVEAGQVTEAPEVPFVPGAAQVNLLSASARAFVEEQRLKKTLAAVAGGVLLGVGAAWGLQMGLISSAESQLAEAQAVQSQLVAEQQALAPVQVYYGQVDANRLAVQTTMRNEVLTSNLLNTLADVTPNNIVFSGVGVSLNTTPPAPEGTEAAPAPEPGGEGLTCPSQDPYGQAVVSAGCINVDGTARSKAQLATWLDTIAAEDLFTVAFIPTIATGTDGGGVSFTASIGIDGETAYSGRYADPEFLKAGE